MRSIQVKINTSYTINTTMDEWKRVQAIIRRNSPQFVNRGQITEEDREKMLWALGMAVDILESMVLSNYSHKKKEAYYHVLDRDIDGYQVSPWLQRILRYMDRYDEKLKSAGRINTSVLQKQKHLRKAVFDGIAGGFTKGTQMELIEIVKKNNPTYGKDS